MRWVKTREFSERRFITVTVWDGRPVHIHTAKSVYSCQVASKVYSLALNAFSELCWSNAKVVLIVNEVTTVNEFDTNKPL